MGDRHVPPRAARVSVRWRAALVLIAMGAAFVPIPAAAIERFYSAGLYLALQPHLTSASHRVPFALLGVLIVIASGAWLGAIAVDFLRTGRGPWVRHVARIITRTVVWAAALYLLFLM